MGACLGIVAVVASVGIVTASQGDLFWLYGPPSSGCAPPPPCQGLCTGPAFDRPLEQTLGPNHWYNFSVQSAGGGLVWDEWAFQVVTGTGGNVTPTSSWTAVVLDLAGSPIATYVFANSTWAAGGTELFLSSQTLSIDSGATDLTALGDALNVIGVGCYEGSIAIAIP